MIKHLQDQLSDLRELRVDMLEEGKVKQAAYLQRRIHDVYDRLAAMTWALD